MSNGAKKLVLIAALSVLSGGTPGAGEVVRQGVLYSGGTRLESPEEGVSFVVPEGWQGLWPAGSEFIVMQPGDTRITILATVQEADTAEVRSAMSARIELGDGLVLHPTSAVEQRGSSLEASYDVSGAPVPLVARGAARAGTGGVALAFVLVAPDELLEGQLTTLRGLIDDAQISLPSSGPSSGSSTGGSGAPSGDGAQSSDGTSDRWDVYLKGKYIVRYYTTTGYTDETHLWLCSDGSFYRRGAAGGFGGGASGAVQADNSGSWQATGAGATGQLTLRFNDGSVAQHDLSWDFNEDKLYVDGERWLHGENEYCD